MDNADIVLIVVMVLLALLFLASIAFAVFPQYPLLWCSKWDLWMKKRLPEIIVAGEEIYKELGRGISGSRKHTLSIWSVRIAAIIIALAAAFSLWWILVHI